MILPPGDLCTGCAACAQVCPSGALQMIVDAEGFLRPVIKNNCLECGKCGKVCPVLNADRSPRRQIRLFAAYAREDDIRNESSSGGIFTLLARQFVRKGGVVFGAAWDCRSRSVLHMAVKSESDISILSGSKYVQSDTAGCFISVRELLDEGRAVMFSGTPCQLAGLRAFLGRDYENLFTVEIVCHGVSSPMVLKLYLDEIGASSPCSVRFRDKIRGWREFSFRVTTARGGFLCESMKENVFLKGFLSNLYLRRACSNCRSWSKLRGDVVLADFWNIKSENFDMDDNKGVSAVIVVTEKGRAAFEDLTDEIVSVRTRARNFFKTNRNVLLPSPKHPRRDRFFRALADNRAGVIELTRQNLKWTRTGELLWKIRRHFEKKSMARMAGLLDEGRLA